MHSSEYSEMWNGCAPTVDPLSRGALAPRFGPTRAGKRPVHAVHRRPWFAALVGKKTPSWNTPK